LFDFDKLQKIFTNLISNSIKYTEAGGEVHVSLQAKCDDKNDQVLQFVVEDTGMGIPEAALPRVFERFFQVNPTDRRRDGGVGIGLALAKELVESAPATIREAVSKAEAEEIKAKFEEAGAQVELK